MGWRHNERIGFSAILTNFQLYHPMIDKTAAKNFTTILERHGVKQPGVNLGATEALALMESEPIPMKQRVNADGTKAGNNDKGQSVGRLIRAGLAALDERREFYRVTDAGREWLAKLRELKII